MTRSLTVVAVPVRAEGFARQVSEVVYANTSYVTGRPTLIPRYYGGLGTGYGAYAAGPVAQPWTYDVYGPGGNYADAPGTCYVDCDNYRKALIESGYDPKNYRTKAGTVKQTAY